MTAWASVADVEVRYGADLEADLARVEVLIADAEDRIRQACGDPAVRVAAGRTTPGLVAQVISEMVSAVLRNPSAWQSATETVGPFSRSHTLNVAVASGLLRLTDDHRVLLGDRVTGAFTITPAARR